MMLRSRHHGYRFSRGRRPVVEQIEKMGTLEAFYRLDDLGLDVLDESDNERHGVLGGTFDNPEQGQRTRVLHSRYSTRIGDGSDGWIDLQNGFDFLHQTGIFTIACWVFWDGANSGTNEYIFATYLNTGVGTGKGVKIELDDRRQFGHENKIRAGFSGASETLLEVERVALPGWTLIVLTGDGSSMELYVNGVPEKVSGAISPTNDSTAAADTAKLGVRSSTGGNHLNGRLDQVAIWSTHFAESDVSDLLAIGGHAKWRQIEATALDASPTFGTPVTESEYYETTVRRLFGSDVRAHWKFNETSGTVAASEVSTDHDLNWENGPTLGVATGVDGADTAVELDGVDDAGRNAASENNFDPLLGSISLSAWIRRTGNLDESSAIINKFASLPGFQLVASAAGFAQWRVDDGGDPRINVTISGSTDVSDGAWHHVLAVLDRAIDQTRLYVDGALEATGDVAGLDSIDSPNSFLIGAVGEGTLQRFWAGKIDEVSFIDRAATDAEALALYQGGTRHYYTGVVATVPRTIRAHWSFDESTGATVAASRIDSAHDLNINGGVTLQAASGVTGGNREFELDGVDGELSNAGVEDNFDVASNSMSLSGWFTKTNSALGHLLSKLDATPSYELRINADGTVTFRVDDGTNAFERTSTATVDDGALHHVAAVVDKGLDQLRLYLDGALVGTAVDITGLGTLDNANIFRIGASNNVATNFHAGRLEEWTFFDDALVQADVDALRNGGI